MQGQRSMTSSILLYFINVLMCVYLHMCVCVCVHVCLSLSPPSFYSNFELSLYLFLYNMNC